MAAAMDRTDVAEGTIRSARHQERGRGRRRLRAVLILVGLSLIVGVGLGLVWMLPARAALVEARDAMLQGQDHLLAGEVGQASDSFGRAEAAFSKAGDHLGNPLTRLASLIPILGRTPDTVTAVAEAGTLVAEAGQRLGAAVEHLPGGPEALVPRNSTIQLGAFEQLAPALGEVRGLVVEADTLVRGSPRTWIPDVVASALFRFQEEVGQLRRAVTAAEAITRALPSFLGVDERQRYFVAAQNPAELRGTGGLIGSFTILEADNGRLRFDDFSAIQELPDAIGHVESPNPDYEALYVRWGGAGYWANLNRTPDFPSAAVSIERLYEAVRGIRLDGVIAANPQALSALLEPVGPVGVPGTDATLDSSTVVPFVTNEAYSRLPAADRKRILGDVAGEVLRQFLSDGATEDPIGAVRSVIDAAIGGHLRFHSTDAAVQNAFDQAGVTGRLLSPEGDYLSVVVNNNGANKIDFYLEESIRYEVQLEPGGGAIARTVVDLGNQAPDRGQPAYVIGPSPFKPAEPGESIAVLSTYCARSCQIHGFEVDGAPKVAEPATELRHPLLMSNVRIPSGGTQRMEYGWAVPDAWSGDVGAGTYRLTFQGQPTIRPATLELEIQVPDGMEIVRTSPGVRVIGDRAIWRGAAPDLSTFEVEFYRPLLSFRE
jgi:Protein of unknown function (DUF4012)